VAGHPDRVALADELEAEHAAIDPLLAAIDAAAADPDYGYQRFGAAGDGPGTRDVGAGQGVDDAPFPEDARVAVGRRRRRRDPHGAAQLTPADLVDLVLRAAGKQPVREGLALPGQALVVQPPGEAPDVDH
jgi:hypothetical protein